MALLRKIKKLHAAVGAVFALGALSLAMTSRVSSSRFLVYERPKDDPNPMPILCWLLAYPKSGGSTVQQLIHEVSGTSTATNYGFMTFDTNNEPVINAADSVPFASDRWLGPWKSRTDLPSPDEIVLTRTFCDGVCMNCDTAVYTQATENVDNFFEACSKGSRRVRSKTNPVEYYKFHGRAALILVQNPFDVIVKRFFNEYDKRSDYQAKYSRDPAGFRNWCSEHDLNPERVISESRVWEIDAFQLSMNGICRAEFYRYIKYYNNIHVTTEEKLGYLQRGPHTLFYYEDFHTDVLETTKRLMEFLHLIPENLHYEFPYDGGYISEGYYTKRELKGVALYMKSLALPHVWDVMEHYFVDYM